MKAMVIYNHKLICIYGTSKSLFKQADKLLYVYLNYASPNNPKGVIDIYKAPPVIRKNGV